MRTLLWMFALLDRGHYVAFFAIQAPVVRDSRTARVVVRAIESARGVRNGTAHVSLENAALSFAFDPARTSVARAQEDFARGLARQGIGLALLTLLDGRPQLPRSAGAK